MFLLEKVPISPKLLLYITVKKEIWEFVQLNLKLEHIS